MSNQTLQNRIDKTVEKIQETNESIAFNESRGNDYMVKLYKRERAGYRAHLTRLHKRLAWSR